MYELISILTLDIVIDINSKFFLGRRINHPAKGLYFTPGGRVFKNESIEKAAERICFEEAGLSISFLKLKFIGVQDHIFPDSIYHNINQHCINLVFLAALTETNFNPPKNQHSDYKWLTLDQISEGNEVHIFQKKLFFKLNKLLVRPDII